MLGALSVSVQADEIYGTFNFTRLPPHAAVVYIPDQNAPERIAHVDQKNIEFTKTLDVGTAGTKVIFSNSDQHIHNLFASNYKSDTKFDVGLIPPGKEVQIPVTWPEDTLLRVGCNIHSNMRTYIANIQSSNFTLVDFVTNKKKKSRYDDGGYKRKKAAKKLKTSTGKYKFKLYDVSAAADTVNILLPHYDLIEIKLSKGESKSVPLMRRGKQKGELTVSRS
ncbi:hypothetical protein [Litoribacillus peritrichatus]